MFELASSHVSGRVPRRLSVAVKVMGGGCKSHPQMFVSAYGVCVCFV